MPQVGRVAHPPVSRHASPLPAEPQPRPLPRSPPATSRSPARKRVILLPRSSTPTPRASSLPANLRTASDANPATPAPLSPGSAHFRVRLLPRAVCRAKPESPLQAGLPLATQTPSLPSSPEGASPLPAGLLTPVGTAFSLSTNAPVHPQESHPTSSPPPTATPHDSAARRAARPAKKCAQTLVVVPPSARL